MTKGPVEEFTVGGGEMDWSPSAEDGNLEPARRPWRGPVAWVSCAVVLVLIGMVLARPLQIGTEPWGAVADITSTPREAWSLPLEEEIRSVLLADGVLVAAGAQRVQGLEPGSGDQLWELAMVGARCTTDTENLVCTDTASQVQQIDPHSGETTALDVPQAIVATVSGGDVFAVTRAGQGQVQRLSDGEVLWSTPVTAIDDNGLSRSGLTVIAGQVLTPLVMDQADFGASGAVLDAETGERWEEHELFVTQLSAGVWLASHRDGGTIFVHGMDQPSETVGAGGFLQYDDQWQSSAQIGTTADNELGIVDRESGDWLWHTDYPAYPMARAGGVLVALIADGQTSAIQGLRVTTGEPLWQHPNTWLMCPCLSDGSTLAGQSYEIGADGSTSTEQAIIVGLDVSSGEQVWSLPRPQRMLGMLTDGRHLVLASPWELSGWRLG
ncbi:PQQ-binding-like beta-propeller repeat protein [Ruania zhangjianzhongii]|uniref:outer membrane protein assembly factor BamB family protein n=1 Tax=Ruania zhangjianzhongii TaxID=2603206 RepID=UPI0011C9F388|nr:PQQ-binding-like beta-propeller repeat protein [Ruania zhangjianzhongii]